MSKRACGNGNSLCGAVLSLEIISKYGRDFWLICEAIWWMNALQGGF